MPTIQLITTDLARTVRHPVLRDKKPYDSCFFKEDLLPTTFHFGIFEEKIPIGVVTFINTPTLLASATHQYQLRGMAVLPQHQHKNYGRQLITYGIAHLRNLKIQILWCNARAIAMPFYVKNGFEIIGDPFEIPKIGTHYCMQKIL